MTMQRIGLGFFFAMIIGIIVGILRGVSRTLETWLDMWVMIVLSNEIVLTFRHRETYDLAEKELLPLSR
jgi:ABC-type antimicrobial peptide transport system permease subunit